MNKRDLERLARMKACGRHSWAEMGDFLGVSRDAARNQWRRRARHTQPEPGPCPLCLTHAAEQAGGDEDPEGQEWEEHGNYAEARMRGPRVRSLEDLLAIVRPDLEVWRTLDWGVKRWEVGAKIKEGHLEWADSGIKTGYLDYKGLGKTDLWSVWAKFVRREPVPIHPIIQPVQCDTFYARPVIREYGGLKQGLILPDVQMGFARDQRSGILRPFHDRRALDITIQIVAALQPEIIVLLGDFLDLTMMTDKFIRSPEFYFTTQPAILEGFWYLRSLREAAPEARIVLLMGNHEERMDKIMAVHLLEACDLRAADELDLPPALSVPKLLALHQLGVEWMGDYPDGEVWLGPLRAVHGDRVSGIPGGSARAVVDDNDQDTVFGHIHRVERVSRRMQTNGGWRTVRSFSPGCLCHLDGRVPGSKAGDNWQQGFAVVEFTDQIYTATLVEITDGACVYGGVWKGHDYVDTLANAWEGWRW